jgi:flavin-dependent dehydrogenase
MIETYDVIVIGGGPGGSMASTLLAQSGRNVLLLEREKFPRYHVGESLLSGTSDLLGKINVLEDIEKENYIKKNGVTWVWGKDREPWTVYFKDALAMAYDYGYQVDRASFDKVLLDNARKQGVRVLEQHRVTELIWEDKRLSGVVYESTQSKEIVSARSSWVIDASGRPGLVTRQVYEQEWDTKLRKNMAVWSYWKGAKRPEGFDAGNTYLPTFEDGWWWFIPQRNEITSIGAVISQESYSDAQKQGAEKYYLDAIRRTPEIATRIKDAEMVDEIRILQDWSYKYEKFTGNGFLAVGDAACFIDPLLSTGVHLALLSGMLAAVSVNTIIDRPHDESKILDFYQKQYLLEYNRLKEQVYFLYSGHQSKDSFFWHARNTLNMPNADPERAFSTLIGGAYKHRSWYRRYLQNLDAPENIKKIFDGIFDEKTMGSSMISWDIPIKIRKDGWYYEDSFAINGSKLEPNKVMSFEDGRHLSITECLGMVLRRADGNLTANELVTSISEEGQELPETVRSTINEAITYGVLTPIEVLSTS